MTGRFIAVVGPSGAGKDTVMQAICARHPELVRVRRVITRSAEAVGEDAEAVSEPGFAKMVQEGAFVLHWRAHGLGYGIPASVLRDLGAGRDVLANLSRSVLSELPLKFRHSMVVVITASSEVLARRLAERGREDAQGQAKRLQRAEYQISGGVQPVVIRNEGTLQQTVAAFEAALQSGSA